MKKSGMNLLYTLIAFIAIMVLASTRFEGLDFSSLTWILWSLLGVVIVFGIYWATRDSAGWEIGTRQVVMMGIGAALYGLLNWLFNGTTIALPSISLVAYRPSVAILVLFGYLFGPVVGFFTGAVGNIIGDFLSGWGVFPTWDFGNGLMGFVAGLPMVLAGSRAINKKTLTWVVGLLIVVGSVIALMNTNIEDPWGFRGPETFRVAGWVLLIGGVLALLTRFLGGKLGEESANMNLWGTLGVIIGIAYAAIGDIWISGYSFLATMVGQFAPAASFNILFAVILAPILLAAYNAVQSRAGR